MCDVQDSAAASSSAARSTSSAASSSAAATATATQADRLHQRRDKQMQSCSSKAPAAKVFMCLMCLQLNVFMLALFVAGQLVYYVSKCCLRMGVAELCSDRQLRHTP